MSQSVSSPTTNYDPPSPTGRRSQRGYRCSYDCTEIYRRSHAGYACTYDCTNIYRDDDDDDDVDDDDDDDDKAPNG